MKHTRSVIVENERLGESERRHINLECHPCFGKRRITNHPSGRRKTDRLFFLPSVVERRRTNVHLRREGDLK